MLRSGGAEERQSDVLRQVSDTNPGRIPVRLREAIQIARHSEAEPESSCSFSRGCVRQYI